MVLVKALINDNRWIILVFIVVLLLLAIIIVIRSNAKSRKKRRKVNAQPSKKTYTIRDCISSDDLQFKVDTYQKQLDDELQERKKLIQEAQSKGYIKASTAWTDRFHELTRVSDTLSKNLEYENSRRLAVDRFHRYTSLHFRSVILGNIAYTDYIAAKKVRDEIGELLVSIGKGEVRVSSTEKRALYDIKDTCVKSTKYLYDCMLSKQEEARKFRDKIRDECGQRGKDWYKRNQENRNKR